MRTWQVERRKRTRHLIELGGLVAKAGIVDLTGDDRATILGALLWIADKLQSDQAEPARALWVAKEQIEPFQPFVLETRHWHAATACPERRSSMRWALEAEQRSSRSAKFACI
jgi:hypothetical protein